MSVRELRGRCGDRGAVLPLAAGVGAAEDLRGDEADSKDRAPATSGMAGERGVRQAVTAWTRDLAYVIGKAEVELKKEGHSAELLRCGPPVGLPNLVNVRVFTRPLRLTGRRHT